jgi:hypothetical protein
MWGPNSTDRMTDCESRLVLPDTLPLMPSNLSSPRDSPRSHNTSESQHNPFARHGPRTLPLSHHIRVSPVRPRIVISDTSSQAASKVCHGFNQGAKACQQNRSSDWRRLREPQTLSRHRPKQQVNWNRNPLEKFLTTHPCKRQPPQICCHVFNQETFETAKDQSESRVNFLQLFSTCKKNKQCELFLKQLQNNHLQIVCV